MSRLNYDLNRVHSKSLGENLFRVVGSLNYREVDIK